LKSAEPAGALDRVKIHKAWLVSCVNARAGDIAAAAKELQGRKVAPWVKFYVAAASSEVKASAQAIGDWQVLMDAGAIELPPGCGACAGLGAGTVEAGEVGVAATNRNFKGRMGSRDGVVHLTSPAVVAASAAEGYISSPAAAARASHVRGSATEIAYEVAMDAATAPLQTAGAELVHDFPASIEGDLIWCGADNISTDGIYHGRLMYEDLTKQEMADASMENYDPNFKDTITSLKNPILAAGSNFGTGSSREQAAQCLKYAGVTALLAGSYSATYTRNALNNGLPIFESPELYRFLQDKFGQGTENFIEKPTVQTRLRIQLDLAAWQARLSDSAGSEVGSFALVPLGAAAQELIACGG
jgi:homoaconitate hydratase